jgi:hypothetical protein
VWIRGEGKPGLAHRFETAPRRGFPPTDHQLENRPKTVFYSPSFMADCSKAQKNILKQKQKVTIL